MKLLTLNTHSIQEENYMRKLEWFVDVLLRERPDLVAMQEVNQTMTAPVADQARLRGYVPMEGHIPVLQDNHAAQVARRLWDDGVPCSWTWLPAKRGYGKYDEGLALLSLRKPITETDAFCISRCDDYENWRTRKVLGVRLEGESGWFYTVHMGWWGDEEEPFAAQWEAMERRLAGKREAGPVWLLGDFNAPAQIRDESYDCVARCGWMDTYMLAAEKDGGMTVRGVIDGWRDRLDDASGMRIDQIWCSRSVGISRSRVLFDGTDSPVVSDHFGILVETDKAEKGDDHI